MKKDASYLFSFDTHTLKSTRFFALITALTALLSICGFHTFYTENIYYTCLFLCLIYIILKGGIRFNPLFVFLLAVLTLNVFIVDIPPFFKPKQRLVLFILMAFTATPIIQTDVALKLRRELFKYIVYGLCILSVGSFFCFFLGINFGASRYLQMSAFEMYSSQGGWFGGLVSHSMILGPISMIASIFFLVLYLHRVKTLYLLLFFTSTLSAVFASSRAALLGIVITIVICLLFGNFKKKLKLRLVWLIIFSVILTLPISDIAFKGVINKQQNRELQSSSLNSRQDKFDYRIEEFKSSPIFGVGFCAVDINGGDWYSAYNGRIEPGTSHLAVLSMTGLLGAIAYLLILYRAFENARKSHTTHSHFVLLCFIAMFVHAWFEGYVFSAGGFMALLYWLILGQCIDCGKDVQRIRNASLSSS